MRIFVSVSNLTGKRSYYTNSENVLNSYYSIEANNRVWKCNARLRGTIVTDYVKSVSGRIICELKKGQLTQITRIFQPSRVARHTGVRTHKKSSQHISAKSKHGRDRLQ